MNPKLTDPWFDAVFFRYITIDGKEGTEEVDELMDAQGVFFWCPCGFGKPEFPLDGARPHAHRIPFRNPVFPTPVPDGVDPKWTVSGTGLHDLTLTPSILSKSCWHGFITRGEVIAV
jgi:hypothetical protein